MPGWIDVHDHITWHFGPNGRVEDKSETAGQAALAAAGNAYATLMAGFTTIQSLASPEDKDLRAAVNSGRLPGPRILTALNPIEDAKLTPEQIREAVRKLKADGADLVKIFASRSIRQGGGQTLSDEQLRAACGEATAQGLRSVVHAYRSAVRAAAEAGCTEVPWSNTRLSSIRRSGWSSTTIWTTSRSSWEWGLTLRKASRKCRRSCR
jgi:imidazolonepropionase-like amidohydrolase